MTRKLLNRWVWWRNISVCVGIAAHLALSPIPAHAYSDDTHYSFTYYMARAVGYTPLQSRRIASADVAIDSAYNPETEPVQFTYLAKVMSITGDNAQAIRVHFHAMLDEKHYPNCLPNPAALSLYSSQHHLEAKKALAANKMKLYNYCFDNMRNPGVFLHFLQDEYAHWGYGSKVGHYDFLAKMLANPANLTFGSRTDFLSYEPSAAATKLYQIPPHRNQVMVRETINALRTFLPPTSRDAVLLGDSGISESLNLLENLQRVNPPPLQGMLNFQKHQDYKAAVEVVNQALVRRGDFSPLPAPIKYSFKTAKPGGDIIVDSNLLEDLTLYGNLTVDLPEGAPSGTKAVLRAAQTRDSETEKILGTKALTDGQHKVTFNDCPVGTVIVSVTTPNGVNLEYPYRLEGMEAEFRMPQNRLTNGLMYGLTQDKALIINMGGVGLPPAHVPDQDRYNNPFTGIYAGYDQGDDKKIDLAAIKAKDIRVTVGGRELKVAAAGGGLPHNEGGSMLHQTQLICRIPAGADSKQLEGPIVVSYGQRQWTVGWINRYDIKISYEEGIPGFSTLQGGKFDPWAIHFRGEGILSVWFSQAKPLSKEAASKNILLQSGSQSLSVLNIPPDSSPDSKTFKELILDYVFDVQEYLVTGRKDEPDAVTTYTVLKKGASNDIKHQFESCFGQKVTDSGEKATFLSFSSDLILGRIRKTFTLKRELQYYTDEQYPPDGVDSSIETGTFVFRLGNDLSIQPDSFTSEGKETNGSRSYKISWPLTHPHWL